MSSEWDLPEQRYQETRANPVDRDAGRRAHPMPSRDDDNGIRDSENDARNASMIDPVALFSFIFRNLFKIVVIAFALTALGIVLIRLVPFPYQATATVLVDPRSRGLLRKTCAADRQRRRRPRKHVQIMSPTDSADRDATVDRRATWKTRLSEQEQLEALAKFKKT